MTKHKLLLLALLACMLPLAASAQWQWLDKDGRKVFSDRAPPLDIPEKNILQSPAGARPSARAVAPAAAPATAASGEQAVAAAAPRPAASAPRASGSDSELEQKKKQAEEAEAAKQRAEEQRVAKAKAENCGKARQAKASMDSGIRISKPDGKGGFEILDDAGRASEARRLQGIIDSDCK